LAIGEFRQVGETVKQCAAEDATVVIGTVIDPEMGDTIRVTVVATGLGQAAVRREQPHIRVVTQAVAPAPAPERAAPQGHQQGHHGRPPANSQQAAEPAGYNVYDQPTYMRQRAVGDQLTDSGETSYDLLDVP